MAGIYHEFLSHLKTTGVARTSHFQVTIPVVTGEVDSSLLGTNRLLSLRCETTELPGRQLVTQENKIYGPTYKTPYHSLYQDLTLNFLETGNFFIRQFFESWIDGIWAVANNRLNYPNTYRRDMLVTQYDMTAPEGGTSLQTLAAWQLYGAFPTSVNQMPVSWTEDGLHRVTVTMAYEYYTLLRPGQPKKQLASKNPASPQSRKGSSTP